MAMPMIHECSSPASLKEKLMSSICCFSSPPLHHEILEPSAEDMMYCGGNCKAVMKHQQQQQPQTPRSPSSWLKSTAHDLEIKDKCLGLIGKRGKSTRKRHSSADFRYDPESYSLNFEGDNGREDDVLPLKNFTSRLPATPERLSVEKWAESPRVSTLQRSELLALS